MPNLNIIYTINKARGSHKRNVGICRMMQKKNPKVNKVIVKDSISTYKDLVNELRNINDKKMLKRFIKEKQLIIKILSKNERMMFIRVIKELF